MRNKFNRFRHTRIKKRAFNAFGLLVLLLFSGPAVAGSEKGKPAIRNYRSSEYAAHSQNFSAIQDDRGVMYFGNTSGVLEYDGESWRLISTSQGVIVRSLAKDNQGRIYVGARGEIGFLSASANGEMEFNTLNDKIPESHREFKDVWYTYATSEAIHFVTESAMFTWQNSEIAVQSFESKCTGAFLVNGKVFLQLKDAGLFAMEKEQLVTVLDKPSQEVFADKEIQFMAVDKKNRISVGTVRSGLYSLQGRSIKPIELEVNAMLKEAYVSTGTYDARGNLIIGTELAGIFMLSPEGKLESLLNQGTGLQNEHVRGLFIDKEGSLWAALDNGISHISIQSPLSYFDEDNGLAGVQKIIRFEGKLHLATSEGLFVLKERAINELDVTQPVDISYFEPVSGIAYACYDLFEFESELFVASAGGIYKVKGSEVQKISDAYTFSLYLYKSRTPKLLAGEINGLSIFEKEGNQWQKTTGTEEVNSEVVAIEEVKDGVMWLESSSRGIFQLIMPSTLMDGAELNISRFDTTHGLPALVGNQLQKVLGKVYVSTNDGVMELDENRRSFQPVSQAGLQSWVSNVSNTGVGSLLVVEGDETGMSLLRPSGDSAEMTTAPFAPVSDFITRTVFADEDNTLWMGGPNGLIRYNEVKEIAAQDYHCLIRGIYLLGDSLLFGGNNANDGGIVMAGFPDRTNRFAPEENVISFEYAAAFFQQGARNQYQYYLEGFESGWSSWTEANQKEYTNLDNGKYRFHVRARNTFGQSSLETSYSFVIQTPWYEEWWAWVIYISLFLVVVFVAGKLRANQLEKEKRALEKIIEERTAEVVDQKEEIEQQTKVLSVKNKELEKISHMVKSVNTGISFTAVLQTIIEETRIIKGVERAAFLIFEKTEERFFVKSSAGWTENETDVKIAPNEALELFTEGAAKVGDDIYFTQGGYSSQLAESLGTFSSTSSALVMVIRVENDIEGYLVLENTYKKQAFKGQDFELLGNFKEHIVSAFIKAKILENLQQTFTSLKETQAKLVSQEKMAGLGQLTAGIAHEINNPINFVSGNIKPLRRDLADLQEVLALYAEISEDSDLKEKLEEIEELKEDIDFDYVVNELDDLINDIEEGASRTAEIVKELRNFSRLDEDSVKMGNIEEGLDSTLTILKSKYKEKVEVVKEYGGIPEIECNSGKLNQVFMNILNNAVQAIEVRGTVTIGTEDRGENIAIKIKDTGKGMSEEVKSKVFDPFFTTKDVGEGTGLGMSITFGIIEDHQGEIEVESEEGVGTEFTLILPKVRKRSE